MLFGLVVRGTRCEAWCCPATEDTGGRGRCFHRSQGKSRVSWSRGDGAGPSPPPEALALQAARVALPWSSPYSMQRRLFCRVHYLLDSAPKVELGFFFIICLVGGPGRERNRRPRAILFPLFILLFVVLFARRHCVAPPESRR